MLKIVYNIGSSTTKYSSKNWPFPASFSLFLSFQYTVDSKQMFNLYINFCRWLDLNHRPLVSEATALPTQPQTLPSLSDCLYSNILRNTALTFHGQQGCFNDATGMLKWRNYNAKMTQFVVAGCCIHSKHWFFIFRDFCWKTKNSMLKRRAEKCLKKFQN